MEPIDNAGPQLLSGAIGIKQDDGTTYALLDKTGGQAPTNLVGVRIEVTGELITPQTPYKSAGTITVISIKPL